MCQVLDNIIPMNCELSNCTVLVVALETAVVMNDVKCFERQWIGLRGEALQKEVGLLRQRKRLGTWPVVHGVEVAFLMKQRIAMARTEHEHYREQKCDQKGDEKLF